MCWHSTALAYGMGHQIEVHPFPVCEGVVQNSPRRWSAKVVGSTGVYGCADALLNYDEDQFWLIVGEHFEAFYDLWNLILLHHRYLAI